MGGPGLLAVVGTAKELPKVDLPDCKILVDVGSFYPFLVRSVYNSKMGKPEEFAAIWILNKFNTPNVEFFIDGHGNKEKHATSMARRDNQADLDSAESIVKEMEDRAAVGKSTNKTDYRTCTKLLRSCTSLTYDFKDKLSKQMASQLADRFMNDYQLGRTFEQSPRHVQARRRIRHEVIVGLETLNDHQLKQHFDTAAQKYVKLVDGEADLAIVRRAKELVIAKTKFVVVGNDCDYAIHPSIPILLRPSGKKYIQYNVDELLAKSERTRAQFTVLGCVSKTDYNANLAGFGIVTNSRIIKSCSKDIIVDGIPVKDAALKILDNYYEHKDVKEAIEKIDPSDVEMKENQRASSKRIFIDGVETPLSDDVKLTRANLENQTRDKVIDLKKRMLAAGKIRRQVLKSRKEKSTQQTSVEKYKRKRYNRFKTVQCPRLDDPSHPGYSPKPDDSATPDPARQERQARQHLHRQSVNARRLIRDDNMAIRAGRCKAEYKSKGFHKMPSKQFAIKVHCVGGAGTQVNATLGDPPKDLEFKPFKPFDPDYGKKNKDPENPEARTKPETKPKQSQKKTTRKSGQTPKTPKAPKPATPPSNRALRKSFFLKSLTGRHACKTLNMGQLGSNIDKAISASWLAEHSNKTKYNTLRKLTQNDVRLAVVKTMRRIARVANELLRHGQDAVGLYITDTKDLRPLKEALFLPKKLRDAAEAAKAAASIARTAAEADPTNTDVATALAAADAAAATAIANADVDSIINNAGKKRLANIEKKKGSRRRRGSKTKSADTPGSGPTGMDVDALAVGLSDMDIDTSSLGPMDMDIDSPAPAPVSSPKEDMDSDDEVNVDEEEEELEEDDDAPDEDNTGDGDDDEGDIEDESGMKGDNGGFMVSLLRYFRHQFEIGQGNTNRHLIEDIRSLYSKVNTNFDESMLLVLTGIQAKGSRNVYLEGGIVAQLGIRLACQLRRYFIDQAAGIATSLPQSPIRNGYIRLSELDLWNHFQYVWDIFNFIMVIRNAEKTLQGLPASTQQNFKLELNELPPGWLLTKLVTPLGKGDKDKVTTATIQEMSDLRAYLVNDASDKSVSSSEFLMAQRRIPDATNLVRGQPKNFLPSYLHRGSIVTNGSHAYLSTVDLRIRKQQRFITEIFEEGGGFRRRHVLSPDNRKLLPNLSTAVPSQESLTAMFPDTTRVDIGAIDLGKEFMVGFACKRYDSDDFIYTISAKTRAVYQPSNRRRSEVNRLKNNTIIDIPVGESAKLIPPRKFTPGMTTTGQAIAMYETRLESMDNNPKGRIQEKLTPEYHLLSSFYNKGHRHQKSEAQTKRATTAELDILTNHILTAMGTHLRVQEDGQPRPRGVISIGQDGKRGFSSVSKGYEMSKHNTFLDHFVPRARRLGYIIVGLPEYYTSRRCPKCQSSGISEQDFVGYIGIRRAHCVRCGTWFHRDLLAASNMVVATRYYLDHLSRPAYLLPITKDEKFVFDQRYGPNLPPGVPANKIIRRGESGDQPDIASSSSSSAPPPPPPPASPPGTPQTPKLSRKDAQKQRQAQTLAQLGSGSAAGSSSTQVQAEGPPPKKRRTRPAAKRTAPQTLAQIPQGSWTSSALGSQTHSQAQAQTQAQASWTPEQRSFLSPTQSSQRQSYAAIAAVGVAQAQARQGPASASSSQARPRMQPQTRQQTQSQPQTGAPMRLWSYAESVRGRQAEAGSSTGGPIRRGQSIHPQAGQQTGLAFSASPSTPSPAATSASASASSSSAPRRQQQQQQQQDPTAGSASSSLSDTNKLA
ncbi:hypothetical protein EMPS_11535 [Entomortierella parvispora]|uniref:Cas12f1-like TNB domain-containing protein n=1 Tax=Entomortierella parvispora TaxID=205924 RepID=A0A9P3HMF1_9FUNG|nr:hypothetical protein EMPS_11535 [Entomortierella parvispora]